jgi:hypothetical protein
VTAVGVVAAVVTATGYVVESPAGCRSPRRWRWGAVVAAIDRRLPVVTNVPVLSRVWAPFVKVDSLLRAPPT